MMADDKPKPKSAKRCEHCGVIKPDVQYDYGLKANVCHWCWVQTPIPGPDRNR